MKLKSNNLITRSCFIVLLFVVLTNSIASPQFLMWLVPFVAFLTTVEITMFIGASSLTWIYTKYWDDVVSLQPMAISILIFRNIVLILLFVVSTVLLIKQTRDLKRHRKPLKGNRNSPNEQAD